MNKLEKFLKQYDSTMNLIGLALAILGIILGVNFVVNSINSNINRNFSAIENSINNTVTVNGLSEKTIQGQLYEAQQYFEAGNYTSAIAIYQNIHGENSIAKLNLGYLHAKGLGTEQNTYLASQYYKDAYEMGNALGLQNYISINLTAPSSYLNTLDALKYGYDRGNETAIKYLSICHSGKLTVVPLSELAKTAADFLAYDAETQLSLLGDLLAVVDYAVVYLNENERPENLDFVHYTKLSDAFVKKVVSSYTTMTDSVSNEKQTVEVFSVETSIAYKKETSAFYMAGYFTKDMFNKV